MKQQACMSFFEIMVKSTKRRPWTYLKVYEKQWITALGISIADLKHEASDLIFLKLITMRVIIKTSLKATDRKMSQQQQFVLLDFSQESVLGCTFCVVELVLSSGPSGLEMCQNSCRFPSLHFNGHFPGEPGLAIVYRSKGWWKWWW